MSQPAYVSDAAKAQAWAERSANGFPVGASEWEDKMHEKHAWVQDMKGAGRALGLGPFQSGQSGQSGSACMYSAQGNIVCQK